VRSDNVNILKLDDVREYVNKNIVDFHQKRIEKLKKLKLRNVLKRKNPYLFRAKNILIASELVKLNLDAYLSSQEEAIFGDFLENLAVFVCGKVYGGQKSSTEGFDLEFSRDRIRYFVSIKSGPNWGNSGQIKRMVGNFKQAKKILRGGVKAPRMEFVNGCCYGQDENPDKGDYLKLCGQRFWELISGNDRLYIDIIEPLGYKAKEKNENFMKEYAQLINKFTDEFSREFCVEGRIDWAKLVELNCKKKK